MSHKVNPTLRRRELAAQLRQLRQDADMSIEQVALQLLVSPTKISRIETGARGARLRDVRDLCEVYGVHADERDRLMSLARQSEESSWWQQLDMPYSKFLGLEAAAASISDYKSDIVPGLLQTADYARAILEVVYSDSSAEVEQLLESRLTRQRRLSGDDPVRFEAVIDESAFRRVVGGRAVMREQLEALVDGAMQANIDIRVLGFEAGAHPAVNSTFTIMQFEEAVSDIVYVEGLSGERYLQRASDLARYHRVFDQLRAIALSPKNSIGESRRWQRPTSA